MGLSDFGRLVRDALSHLYDVVHLQTHPLTRLVRQEHGASPSTAGITLRQNLLDAIEAVRPSVGTLATSKACRRYQILEMHYIEGMDVPEIQQQLAIGKSEYYREHGEALAALISLLRERWHIAEELPALAGAVDVSRDELAKREAEELCSGMQVESLDLAEAIREVVELLQPLGRQKGVIVSAELAPGLGLVQTDRVVLRQALLSVLRQAMDSAAPGQLELRTRPAADHAEIAIATVGHGTAPPLAPEPDYAVGQRLIESLRGRLHTHRMDGRSTTRLVLPTRVCPKVLVVDNSVDFVALVSRYLRQQDWDVIAAYQAEQAYQLAQEMRPNAILLDVMMPGRDGWDLLLKLRATSDTRSIPVIVCSILNEPQVARSLGADGYLAKPVTQTDLLRALAPWQSGRPGVVATSSE